MNICVKCKKSILLTLCSTVAPRAQLKYPRSCRPEKVIVIFFICLCKVFACNIHSFLGVNYGFILMLTWKTWLKCGVRLWSWLSTRKCQLWLKARNFDFFSFNKEPQPFPNIMRASISDLKAYHAPCSLTSYAKHSTSLNGKYHLNWI